MSLFVVVVVGCRGEMEMRMRESEIEFESGSRLYSSTVDLWSTGESRSRAEGGPRRGRLRSERESRARSREGEAGGILVPT